MQQRKLVVFSGFLAALLLVSCASAPERELSAKSPSYAALPNGYDPVNPTQLSRMYAASTSRRGENVVRHLETQ